MWLSGTTKGAFELDAAQGSQTVDEWTKERAGLHVSVSPVVSAGNGGTHKLYELGDGKPCLIDTQNQKGGFNFPPDIGFPPTGVLPPIGGLFPDFGPNFPGAVRPQRPPQGLMPGLPVRPPTGITPGLPVGVTPPIATLPPTGLTPGVPVRPPSGHMPGLPVRPPRD